MERQEKALPKLVRQNSTLLAAEDAAIHDLMRHEDVWGERRQTITAEGKLLGILAGLLIFVVTACYTANLVAFLNINQHAPTYTSRREFETSGNRACVLSGMKSRVHKSLPTLDILVFGELESKVNVFLLTVY